MHGADCYRVTIIMCPEGSSPYARGRFTSDVKNDCLTRFIPVCTGQICAKPVRVSAAAVHPRMHGADTKFLKEIPAVDTLSIPVTLDFYDKFSMYYFFEMYFCG